MGPYQGGHKLGNLLSTYQCRQTWPARTGAMGPITLRERRAGQEAPSLGCKEENSDGKQSFTAKASRCPGQHPWRPSKWPCDLSQTYHKRAASVFQANYPKKWVPEEDQLCTGLLDSLALLLGIESLKDMFLLYSVRPEIEVTQFGALQSWFAVRYMEQQLEERACHLSCSFPRSPRASAPGQEPGTCGFWAELL